MLVAMLMEFNFFPNSPVPPIVEHETGGVSADGLEATELHLEGIYIPNKTVFYAVHSGDHASATQQFWHSITDAHLSEAGKMTGAMLRKLFSTKNFGPTFFDATRPSATTAKFIRPVDATIVKDLRPRQYSESKEQFRSRVRAKLKALLQLGYTKPAPVLVAHTAILRELAAMLSAELLPTKSGDVLEITYDSKFNKLKIRVLSKKSR